jgi:flavodoxin
MKALVIYHSKTGTTKKMAEAIGEQIQKNQMDVVIRSIHEVSEQEIQTASHLYMGSWTNGFMLFGQKPHKDWSNFAFRLQKDNSKKVMLFATYKLRTGSMFSKMQSQLSIKGFRINKAALKSKNGDLSEKHKELINKSLAA